MFEAGSGTTSAAMMSFMLAMVLHPEWFQKLQEEVDQVCGTERLPYLDDVPQLPTVRAVVKEVLRWRPVTAGGLPHMCVKDDVYEGLFIPAGTVMHPNQWAIHREPELYPDPEAYNPQRWLDPSFPTYKEPLSIYPNLHNYSNFGFGRRICPGQNIAERNLYILTARIAWAVDLGKAKDEDGNEIEPPLYDYTAGFNAQPKWFPFTLMVRSDSKLAIIDTELKRNAENDPLVG
jgi:cytochrome P450